MADVSESFEPLAPIEPARPRRSPLATVVGVLVVLLLVVGGFVVTIGGDDEVTPLELLSAAPDAARDAGTARVEMSASIEGAGMTFDMTGEGAIDLVTGASSFTMDMFGISLEMRMVDQTMYMRLPAIGRPSGVDTEWIGVPVETAEGAANPMAQMQSGTGMIESLRGAGADIEELGEDEINGETVTGYRVIIDMNDAIAHLPEDERAAAAEALDQLQAMGADELPMDVWLNDDGLPVRMTMDMDIPTGDPAVGDASMSMQFDFVDYGADITIEAPPADETTMLSGMTEMQELLGGGVAELS